MSRKSFENYGKIAESLKNHTIIAGRYPFQDDAERKIIPDIMTKLDLSTHDTMLEIGCGTGNLLIPLSFSVKEIVGIDHVSCLNSLKKRTEAKNISLISGNFLDLSINKQFDKILCYSVLHYLREGEVLQFIGKALLLLTSGGMALFGDIPNQSRKDRFLQSKLGKKLDAEWKALVSSQPDKEEVLLESDNELVTFNDDLTMKILQQFRHQGYDTYILPQPPHLPFGYTREDILVIRPD
jgi:ubiquinone/menaquinone biosynthesis C-methylase UbiE